MWSQDRFAYRASVYGPVSLKARLLPFSPCTGNSRACNCGLGALRPQCEAQACCTSHDGCVPRAGEAPTPFTGTVCCIFIMYYCSLHCNLAQSEDGTVISHCNFLFSFTHSPEKWGEFFHEGTHSPFSCTLAIHLALSDPMNVTIKALIYISGRMRQIYEPVIVCYGFCIIFTLHIFTADSSISMDIYVTLQHPI